MNLFDSDRPPRAEYYEEETEKLIEAIRNRGDQRIGQFILNLIRADDDKDYYEEVNIDEADELVEKRRKRELALKNMRSSQFNKLWNIEADELVELIEEHEYHGDEE